MSTPTDRAQLWHALALCASDRAYDLACPVIGGRQYFDPATHADALRAAREFESAALLWRPTDPASTRDCLTQAQAYANGATLAEPVATLAEPVATLVAVNGQPDGDYLAPFTGGPACGGETHLSAWQAADLLDRGYRWAHQWEPDAPAPDAAILAAIAAAAPAASTPTEPSLADTLATLTAAVIAEHDAAMAATEATLARIKNLVTELTELG